MECKYNLIFQIQMDVSERLHCITQRLPSLLSASLNIKCLTNKMQLIKTTIKDNKRQGIIQVIQSAPLLEPPHTRQERCSGANFTLYDTVNPKPSDTPGKTTQIIGFSRVAVSKSV